MFQLVSVLFVWFYEVQSANSHPNDVKMTNFSKKKI